MQKIISLAFLLLTINYSVFSQSDIVWKLDFKNTNVGTLSDSELIAEGGAMVWIGLNNNSTIVNDSEKSKVLNVKYPKNTVGPQTNGSQFLKTLPSKSTDYYLDYYVKFEDGFDFKKGGKLPGLTSGGDKYTGGTHPDNGEGWSARYMWLANGKMVVYLYYVEMDGQWGESVPMNVNFQTGKWYRITQRIKLNSNRDANGILQVWVDGVMVVNRNNFVFRYDGLGLIDSFYFSTFHGGSTSDWAPSVDSYISFDKIIVSTDKPDFSVDSGTSTNIWKSYNVGIYPNIFNVEFDMKASQNNMDGVTGILQGGAVNYSDLSCIVRFNTEGYIDSYDDNIYAADIDVPYTSSDSFHVMMNIDMNTEEYDVYISKNGGDNILLASSFSFRRKGLSMLDTWAIKAEIGSHTITNMKFKNGELSNDVHNLYDISIFPNVFFNRSSFTLQVNQTLNNHNLRLSLITLDGNMLESQNLRIKNSQTSLTFDSLLGQPSGMYLLLIEGESFMYTVKLLVQR